MLNLEVSEVSALCTLSCKPRRFAYPPVIDDKPIQNSDL